MKYISSMCLVGWRTCVPTSTFFIQCSAKYCLIFLLCVSGQTLAQDFVLLPEVEETGEYGWRWGSENNRDSVEAEFEQVESDIVLSYRGYDIDNATEVSVLLNGELLEFMPRSGNNLSLIHISEPTRPY